MSDIVVEQAIITEIAAKRLPGPLAVYRDDIDDIKCVVIRWGDYRGRVAWSNDEANYGNKWWPDEVKMRAWRVVDDILELKQRDEERAAQ